MFLLTPSRFFRTRNALCLHLFPHKTKEVHPISITRYSSSASGKKKKKKSGQSATPVDDFFLAFADFDYNRASPMLDEFERLCVLRGWNKAANEQKNAREGLDKAIKEQFSRKAKKKGQQDTSFDKFFEQFANTKDDRISLMKQLEAFMKSEAFTLLREIKGRKKAGDLKRTCDGLIEEFGRLCEVKGWKKAADERKSAYGSLHAAATKQFNITYGTNEKDVRAWQKLCRRLCIVPVPQELETCIREVHSVHVNIWDYVDYRNRIKLSLPRFKTVKALSEYTISNDKIFPLNKALAGGLLRELLRRIFNPPDDKRPSATKMKKD